MWKTLFRLFLGGWIAVMAASAAVAGDAGGKAAYEKLCLSCHGTDGKGNPAMTKVFSEKELNIVSKETAGKKADELVKVIVNGKGKMPAAGKDLSKTEQKQLVDYVKSLAK